MTEEFPQQLTSSTALNELGSMLPDNIQIQVQSLKNLLHDECHMSSELEPNAILHENFSESPDLARNKVPIDSENICTNFQCEHANENSSSGESSVSATPLSSTNPQTNGKLEKSEKLRKDGSKSRHKEDRSIEHVLKALHSLKTPEERLAALCKKYTDLLEEHRSVQVFCKQTERKSVQMVKEKEQLQADFNKAILARIRLEGLCRELQKQSKLVKDESVLRVREEEEKRKEVSAKFQTTLTEISSLMQENNQKNSVLREENLELGQKLKSLVEQYELREQHIEKILKHKELELQLSEAKLAKANMVVSEEKEKYLRDKQKLLEDMTEYQRRCTEMANNEVQLRAQLNMYTDKYSDFQDTLTKSNQVFTSFKGEMEKMSKKIKKLEKETGTWRTRWENSNRSLLQMAEDKQKHDIELLNAQKKIAQLEKLCRAMQVERTALQLQLKIEKSQPGSNVPVQENGSDLNVADALTNMHNAPDCDACSQCSADSVAANAVNNESNSESEVATPSQQLHNVDDVQCETSSPDDVHPVNS